MSVYAMSVDKMSMNAMSVDKMSLYVMSVDKMHENKMMIVITSIHFLRTNIIKSWSVEPTITIRWKRKL
jgi:hypothetical protein